MKKTLIALSIIFSMTSCSGDSDGLVKKTETLCEDFDWGHGCTDVYEQVMFGRYIGGSIHTTQKISDSSYGFTQSDVIMSWDCDVNNGEPQLAQLLIDGQMVNSEEFDLESFYESADIASKCQ
jgi:hypothetical protein